MCRDPCWKRFLGEKGGTEVSDEEAFDAKMFELFGFFQGDGGGSIHVIIFVVDGQLDFFLVLTDLVELLVVSLIEFDVDVDRAGDSSEEG